MKDKYLSVNDNSEFRTHFDKWNFFDFEESLGHNTGKPLLINPGQIFLFEKYSPNSRSGGKVCYPKLAVFLSYIPCDQTVEIEYSLIKRTYQLNKNQYLESEIKRDAQWHNYHMIYGVWDSYPSWKELRSSYERTWWFHKTKQQKRDIKLNNILNE